VDVGGELAEVNVRQEVPWLPMILALVGGAIGGFLRRFSSTDGGDGRRIVEGAIVGFLVYVGAVLGVRMIPQLPVAIAGVAFGALLWGFAGGYLGVAAIDRFFRPSA
jgi:hydrogenase/urease accessory protein HupE